MFRRLILAALLLSTPFSASACDGRSVDGPGLLRAPACVPTKAERIIVLDPTYSLGMALELGLPVVGAPLFGMSDETLHEEALNRSVQDLGAFTDPSIEKIIALKPDLIIGSGMLGEKILDMANRIAPTVLITQENWKEYYAKIAEVTGKSAEARAALQDYETRVGRLKARVPDKTISILRITSWDFQVYLDSPVAYGPFAILRELGVRRSAYETTDDDTGLKRPDWESLTALDGEILLYIIGGANNSDSNGRHEEVVNNPLWQMLPAVRAARVHRVSAATWMEFSGLASAHRVLDDVERYIIGKP